MNGIKVQRERPTEIVLHIKDSKFSYDVTHSSFGITHIHLSNDVCDDGPIKSSDAKNTLNLKKNVLIILTCIQAVT